MDSVTLSEILRDGAKRFSSSPCAMYQPNDSACLSLTYENSYHLGLQFSDFVCRQISTGQIEGLKGDVVVAFLSGNSVDMMICLLVCTSDSIPAMPVLLNVRWTPIEIAKALETPNKHSFTLLLHDMEQATKAKEVGVILGKKQRIHCVSLPEFSLAVRTDHSHTVQHTASRVSSDKISNFSDSQWSSEDALIVFTSGTTSGSKGVALSHRALYLQALAKLGSPCNYSMDTVLLATTVPLFHVGGLSSALALWLAGGVWTFPEEKEHDKPKTIAFQPQLVLQTIQHRRMPTNTLVVVPTMLVALFVQIFQNKNTATRTFPQISLILIGGQSATPTLIRQIAKVFPRARVVQTYACTEAASSLTFIEVDTRPSNISFSKAANGMKSGTSSSWSKELPYGDCVGLPPNHIEVDVFLPPRKMEEWKLIRAPRYSQGVIGTRGDHLLNGYWKRGGKRKTRPRDEWFITNDLGFMDDHGRLYFCGRANDVIRTGGESVVAMEVETTVLKHQAILECAVFALPDDKFGETVCCAMVGSTEDRSSRLPTLAELRQWCARCGLAGYKRPRRLFYADALPRNSSGKLIKRVLVQRYGSKEHWPPSKL